jgi:DNA-binding CsgD family transcriptional regulator
VFGILGLTSVQEAVYRTALDGPHLSDEEIAQKLDLGVDEVRTVLVTLLDMRIMRESHEEPGRLVAVDPVVGLQDLLAREHEQLMERQQQIAASQSLVLRMLAERDLSVGATTGDGVQRLVGVDVVQQRLERLSRDVQRSVMTFMPGGAQSSAALEAARVNDARALGRGVTIRTIGLDSIRENDGTLSYARWLADGGGEFRTAPVLPPRMVVVDQRMALVPIDPRDTRRGALFLTEPGVVVSLVALFEQVWEVATPLGADRHPDREGLSPQEKKLLMLIAQGHTDESAAGKMFISPRTARRMMASIMERLGARSRFEAGVRAAQNGWL